MATRLPSGRTLQGDRSIRTTSSRTRARRNAGRVLRSGLAIAIAIGASTRAQGPSTVRADSGDCEGDYGLTISDLTPFGDRLLFAVSQGSALWTSDGTPEGTTVIRSLDPGPDEAPPGQLTDAEGTLYFTGWDRLHGTELWRTDGTPDGTNLVSDIRVGRRSGVSALVPDGRGGVYLTADDGRHGLELWASDGMAEGTHLVKDIRRGRKSGHPRDLTASAGSVFYTETADGSGLDLWRSDGTAAGTVTIGHFPGSRNDTYLAGGVTLGRRLVFAAQVRGHGAEVWQSDGSAAGTTLVRDLGPGRTGSIRSLSAAGDAVYLSADDGEHGTELWRTDGTTEGTALVADILPGPLGSAPSPIVDAAGTLFFGAGEEPYDPEAEEEASPQHLWRTDGTATGTLRVSDVTLTGEFGAPSGDCDIEPSMAAMNGMLYFAADDGEHGSELWRSDGTTEGTELVADLAAGSESGRSV